jgi:hypothetical protein
LILPGLIHQGGYDYNAIQVVFNNCGLSQHIREIYHEQCVTVIDVIHKKRGGVDEKKCNEKKRQECELMFGKDNMQWACKNCEASEKQDLNGTAN